MAPGPCHPRVEPSATAAARFENRNVSKRGIGCARRAGWAVAGGAAR